MLQETVTLYNFHQQLLSPRDYLKAYYRLKVFCKSRKTVSHCISRKDWKNQDLPNKTLLVLKTTEKIEQAGTGPSRRHIQGSKIEKRLPSVKYSLLQYSEIKKFPKKLHTQKIGPSGAPGPARASPWRAKRGTLPKLSTFLSKGLKGGPFGEKTNFRKKISQCRKTERGDPLGF